MTRHVVYLPAGRDRRVFVDRVAYARGEAPFIVEGHATWHAWTVDIEMSPVATIDPDGFARLGGFKSVKDARDPPVMWFETRAALRLEISE